MSKMLFSLLLSITLFAQMSWGQIASTEAMLNSVAAPSAHEKVTQFMAREDVAKAFEQMGVDTATVQNKVAALSDSEINAIASQIDTLPAGGDAFGGILGTAVFIFLLLLVTDILGYTKVFSFTRSAR